MDRSNTSDGFDHFKDGVEDVCGGPAVYVVTNWTTGCEQSKAGAAGAIAWRNLQ